jgi:hypothetical protein
LLYNLDILAIYPVIPLRAFSGVADPMYRGVMPLAVYDCAIVTDSSATSAAALVVHLGVPKFDPVTTEGAKSVLALPHLYCPACVVTLAGSGIIANFASVPMLEKCFFVVAMLPHLILR